MLEIVNFIEGERNESFTDYGTKAVPYGDYKPVEVSVSVEDEVRKGEDVDEAYDRLRELKKFLFYKNTMDTLQDTLNPRHEMDKLVDECTSRMSEIDIDILEKNDK